MRQSLKIAVAVVTFVASGAVFAQNTPAKQETKPQKEQVAQKGGQSAGAGQTAMIATSGTGFAGMGIPGLVAASLSAVGMAATNDTTTAATNH